MSDTLAYRELLELITRRHEARERTSEETAFLYRLQSHHLARRLGYTRKYSILIEIPLRNLFVC